MIAPRRERAAIASWLLVLLPWAAVLGYCLAREPVLRDGWGTFLWWREAPLSWSRLWEVARGNYLGGNPRLGQLATVLLFSPSPLTVVATTVVGVAVPVLATALALGRWPSWRRVEDAWLCALALAMMLAAVPQVGPMFCYRPFAGNYVYGFVLHLLLYLPYRLAQREDGGPGAERGDPRGAARWWRAPLLLLGGALAGLCNEHTGPASLLLLAFAVAQLRRGGARFAAWWLAAPVGLALGYAALYFAPGQAVRYAGLAQQQALLSRIVDRPLRDSLEIVGLFALAAAVTSPWWLLAARASGAALTPARRRWLWAWLAAGALMVLTLFASPKTGPRLYFAPVLLLVIAAASYAEAALAVRWARRAMLALAAAVIVYAGASMVRAYHEVAPQFAWRLAALDGAAAGSALTLPPLSVPRSRWFLGDDLVVPTLRGWLAGALGLESISLRAPPPPVR